MRISIPQKLESVLRKVTKFVILPSHLLEQFEEMEPTARIDRRDRPMDLAIFEPGSTGCKVEVFSWLARKVLSPLLILDGFLPEDHTIRFMNSWV